jgi:hypothetical protein
MGGGQARHFVQTFLRLWGPGAAPAPAPAPAHTHDLDLLCRRLCERYFGGPLDVDVGWGRDVRGRASMTFGSYSFTTHRIRIHPRLDRRDIPSFFVEAVLFHELVHHVVGCERSNGRRRLHTPRFREIESRYEHAELARRWRDENLHRLLGRRAAFRSRRAVRRREPLPRTLPM